MGPKLKAEFGGPCLFMIWHFVYISPPIRTTWGVIFISSNFNTLSFNWSLLIRFIIFIWCMHACLVTILFFYNYFHFTIVICQMRPISSISNGKLFVLWKYLDYLCIKSISNYRTKKNLNMTSNHSWFSSLKNSTSLLYSDIWLMVTLDNIWPAFN